MQRKTIVALYKLVFGLLAGSAIATEIVVLVHRGTFNPGNFFSFFTIESNLLITLTLLASAWATYKGKQSGLLDMLRGAATLYMVITGIVFTLLLSGIENAEFTAVPWDNIVLHYLLPVVALADWLIDVPRLRIGFRKALVWLSLPLFYAAYSLVRGHVVGWYPYPFLDPNKHGYAGVASTSVSYRNFRGGFGSSVRL